MAHKLLIITVNTCAIFFEKKKACIFLHWLLSQLIRCQRGKNGANQRFVSGHVRCMTMKKSPAALQPDEKSG